jgi:predicted PurR-regulated permease PerM
MIALGFTLYLTASSILEVVVAIMLALLLAPAVNALARLRIPNPAGAGILPIGLLAIIATLGVRLTSPVQRWIETEPGQFLAYLFGRRFSINPVVIFVWVLFWAWMWGGGGLLLAVPMLVAVRICADRIPRLQPLATILSRS